MFYEDYLDAADADVYADCYTDIDCTQRDLRRFSAIARDNSFREEE